MVLAIDDRWCANTKVLPEISGVWWKGKREYFREWERAEIYENMKIMVVEVIMMVIIIEKWEKRKRKEKRKG